MKRIFAIIAAAAVFSTCWLAVFQLSKAKSPVLSNPDAGDSAKEVFAYIADCDKVLSAQQESTWMGSSEYEMNYIFEASGKYPVIRGLDYMNDDFDGVNQRAVEWWNKGGLVTICWHCGSDFSGEWKDCMQSEVADWSLMFTEGTDEYNNMIKGMDKAAKALLELKEQGVVVLWRPFHEFDGNWFWWSKGGAENFKKLWITMYDRYTDYWQLDNLIWVLGFSDQGENSISWYPGDKYCDIIGADTYSADTYSALYRKIKNITFEGKPVCLHECGDNPAVKEFEKQGWCWFMTWHTEYLTDRNSADELNELYNSDIVITLDEFDLNA